MNAWYSALIELRNSIASANDAIDTKANAIIASCMTTVTILFVLLDAKGQWIMLVPLTLLVLSIIATVILAVRIVKLRATVGLVNTPNDQPSYIGMKEDERIMQLISDVQASIGSLRKINDEKSGIYRDCHSMFLISFSLLVVCLIIKLTI